MALCVLLRDELLIALGAQVVFLRCCQRRRLAFVTLAVPALITHVANGALVHTVAVVAHEHPSTFAASVPCGSWVLATTMVAVVPGCVANFVRCFLGSLELVGRKLRRARPAISVEPILSPLASLRALVPAFLILAQPRKFAHCRTADLSVGDTMLRDPGTRRSETEGRGGRKLRQNVCAGISSLPRQQRGRHSGNAKGEKQKAQLPRDTRRSGRKGPQRSPDAPRSQGCLAVLSRGLAGPVDRCFVALKRSRGDRLL